jgi:DNA polymerase I
MPRLRLLPPVTTVYSREAAVEVLQFLMNRGGPVAIDTETTGLDVMRDRILCWSMAIENQRYFIPKEYLTVFDPLFGRQDILWYLANAKYDMHMFANAGVSLRGPVNDIIVMDAMEDDTRAHGLKEQSRIAYDVRWGDFKELFLDPAVVASTLGLEKASFTQFSKMGVGEKLLFVWDESPRTVENYASCDAFFTYQRGIDLSKQLMAIDLPTEMSDGFNTLWDYFKVIEEPFTKVLWKMERTGIPVDLDRVRAIDGPMRDGIRAQEKVVREMIGPSFNPGSGDELAAVLFGKGSRFGLTPVEHTSTGKASTSEKVLKLLQGRTKDQATYAFLDAVLQLRHLSKLHGTFVKKIHTHLGPDDRVHCKINQSGARTGRLSASNPNLMQIPIRNDEFKIRSMFVAPKDMLLLDCDYPQIQPRLAAVFANETKMLDAIAQGFDLHSANAANMYGINDKRVTYKAIEAAKKKKDARIEALVDFEKWLLKKRDGAKTVGLGVLFGEGPMKMAHQLGITVEEATELRYTFFETYPNLRTLIDDTHETCRQTEMAHTMLGRIRRLYQINNGINRGKELAEERAGFNHLIQGSEVEVMKLAMLQIDASKEWQEVGGVLAMTVHDELLAFAPKDSSVEALEVMKMYMADPLKWGPINLTLPVSVDPDGGIGHSWADAH